MDNAKTITLRHFEPALRIESVIYPDEVWYSMAGAGKAETASLQGRVKLHIFEPSGRRIWTVVGSSREYWQSPLRNFCSCSGFHYNKSSGRKGCSHLDAIGIANSTNKIEKIVFSDEEYVGFVAGIVRSIPGATFEY